MHRPLNIKGPEVVWDQLTPREIEYRAHRAQVQADRRNARQISDARRALQGAAFGRRTARFAAALEV